MSRKIIGATVGTTMKPQAVIENARIDSNANAIHTSASGETVVTTDSANATPSIELFGKSTQNTVAGNQLVDYQSIYEANSQRIAIDGENILYTYNGSWQHCDTLVALPQGTYTISAESIPNEVTVYVLKSDNNTVLRSIYGTSKVGTFENTEEAVYVRITSKVAPSTQTTDVIKKLMLNSGTTSLPFEPYVGGEASPNLNYKQDIHYLGESNQLLNLPNVESRTHNGITWTCKDGVVKAVGTTTNIADSSHPTVGLYYDYPVKAGTYYVSGNGANVLVLVAVTNADGSVKYYNQRSFVLDGTETNCHIYLGLQSVGTTVNETLYPMFNKGTTALPFEQYGKGSIEQKFLTQQLFDVRSVTQSSGVSFGSEGWITVTIDNTEGTDKKYIGMKTDVSPLLETNKNYLAVLEVKENSFSDAQEIISSYEGNDKGQFSTSFNLYKDNGIGTFVKVMPTRDSFDDCLTMTRTAFHSVAGENAKITFRLSIIEDTTVIADTFVYEPYSEQVLVHQTPNGLGGIPLGQTIPSAIANSPIHMSGVYWDNATSQYYIGDTKNENGKNVQRIGVETLTNKPNFVETADALGRFQWSSGIYLKNIYLNGTVPSLFNYAYWCYWGNRNASEESKGTTNDYSALSGRSLYVCPYATMTADEVNAKFTEMIASDKPPVVVGVLATPIVTDLTEEELAQYNEIHMNYPNTTIVNSDSAYTEVEYVADTKCYIDNKFKEMKADMTSAIAQLL